MRTAIFLCLVALAVAHEQPTSLISLDMAPERVTMRLHLPLPELELAYGHAVVDHPEVVKQPEFAQYLRQHVRPTTMDGRAWTVRVDEVEVEAAQQSQSGAFREALVRLELTPPAGAGTRDFLLHYDAILHQVVTHKALVSVERDWAPDR